MDYWEMLDAHVQNEFTKFEIVEELRRHNEELERQTAELKRQADARAAALANLEQQVKDADEAGRKSLRQSCIVNIVAIASLVISVTMQLVPYLLTLFTSFVG